MSLSNHQQAVLPVALLQHSLLTNATMFWSERILKLKSQKFQTVALRYVHSEQLWFLDSYLVIWTLSEKFSPL